MHSIHTAFVKRYIRRISRIFTQFIILFVHVYSLYCSHTHAHQSSNLFLTFPIFFFFLILLFYLTAIQKFNSFSYSLYFYVFFVLCVSFILIRIRVVGRTAISNLLEIQSNISHMFSHMHISRIHLYIHTHAYLWIFVDIYILLL